MGHEDDPLKSRERVLNSFKHRDPIYIFTNSDRLEPYSADHVHRARREVAISAEGSIANPPLAQRRGKGKIVERSLGPRTSRLLVNSSVKQTIRIYYNGRAAVCVIQRADFRLVCLGSIDLQGRLHLGSSLHSRLIPRGAFAIKLLSAVHINFFSVPKLIPNFANRRSWPIVMSGLAAQFSAPGHRSESVHRNCGPNPALEMTVFSGSWERYYAPRRHPLETKMSEPASTSAIPLARESETFLYAIAGLCVAIDVGLGAIVNLVKLPVYLDAVGTIAFALLAGRMGLRGFLLSAFVGAAAFVLTGLVFNPVVFWFIPTQVAIAAYSFYVARPLIGGFVSEVRFGLKQILLMVAVGVGLGIVAGAVSAPIIAYVFGGITGAGASLIVAALLKTGANLFQSVLASGFASEPIDKTIQLFVAGALVRATPSRVRRLFI